MIDISHSNQKQDLLPGHVPGRERRRNMELVMRVGIDLKDSGMNPDKVKRNSQQFAHDLLIIGAADLKIGVALEEASFVETDDGTQETQPLFHPGDLISRSALLAKMTERVYKSEIHEYRHHQNTINMMPVAYDVSKVKDRIKEEIGTCDFRDCGKYLGNCDACREGRAVEIVESGFVN